MRIVMGPTADGREQGFHWPLGLSLVHTLISLGFRWAPRWI